MIKYIELQVHGGAKTKVDQDMGFLGDYLNWTDNKCGYVRASVTVRPKERIFVYLHRLVLELSGDKIDGKMVDHINGDTFDNRLCNLRPCNHSQNSANLHSPAKGSSGYRGVTICKGGHATGKPFNAHIAYMGRAINLGYFETAEQAYRVYCEAKAKLFGQFATS